MGGATPPPLLAVGAVPPLVAVVVVAVAVAVAGGDGSAAARSAVAAFRFSSASACIIAVDAPTDTAIPPLSGMADGRG